MKEMRMIRLINDERTLLSVKKVSACDGLSYDSGCPIKDLAECIRGATDYCSEGVDFTGCSGFGAIDD